MGVPNVRKNGTMGTKRGQKCARCPEKWDTGNREGEREGERRREKEREGERRREKERGDKTIARKKEMIEDEGNIWVNEDAEAE